MALNSLLVLMCRFEPTLSLLVECVDLNDVRNKHFVVSSIKDVFDNVKAH